MYKLLGVAVIISGFGRVVSDSRAVPVEPTAKIHVDPVKARAETLLVYFKGGGTIAVSTPDMKPLMDTIRLVTPVSFSVTLARGDLHIVSSSGRPVYAYASLTDAPAVSLSAESSHVVFDKGGAGIRTRP